MSRREEASFSRVSSIPDMQFVIHEEGMREISLEGYLDSSRF
jgi:hypothetical protein